MAIGTPVLLYGGTATAPTVGGALSRAPVADSYIYAAIGSRNALPTSSVAITVADSLSGTWDAVGSQIVAANDSSGPSTRLAVFRRAVPASAGMTVTASHSEAGRLTMHVWEVTGADTVSISNIGTDVDNLGDLTLSITAPSVASLVMAVAFFSGSGDPTSPLTAQLAKTGPGANQFGYLQTVYTLTSGGTSASWTTSNLRSAAMLFEIPVAPTVMTGAGTTGIVGAGAGVQGNVITGAGTIAPIIGLGDLSVDTNLVGAGVLAPLVGAGVVSVGIGIVGAGRLDAVIGQGVVEFTPLPPPDTLTLVIWSRCDRCGLRCRPAELTREPDTGLWLHPHCMDDVRSLRRPRRPVTRFRNPRPDTELETNR
jgi:hypothetical protein